MLSIDGKIVNDNITNFIAAINLMFESYYCLNIHYPVDLGSTLEFFRDKVCMYMCLRGGVGAKCQDRRCSLKSWVFKSFLKTERDIPALVALGRSSQQCGTTYAKGLDCLEVLIHDAACGA